MWLLPCQAGSQLPTALMRKGKLFPPGIQSYKLPWCLGMEVPGRTGWAHHTSERGQLEAAAQHRTLPACSRKQEVSQSRAPQPCEVASLSIPLLAQHVLLRAGQVAVVVLLAPPHAAQEIVLVSNGLQQVGLHQANVVQLRGGSAPGGPAAPLHKHLWGESSAQKYSHPLQAAVPGPCPARAHERRAWQQCMHPAVLRAALPALLLGREPSCRLWVGGRGQGLPSPLQQRKVKFLQISPPSQKAHLAPKQCVAGASLRNRPHHVAERKRLCGAADPRKTSANSSSSGCHSLSHRR